MEEKDWNYCCDGVVLVDLWTWSGSGWTLSEGDHQHRLTIIILTCVFCCACVTCVTGLNSVFSQSTGWCHYLSLKWQLTTSTWACPSSFQTPPPPHPLYLTNLQADRKFLHSAPVVSQSSTCSTIIRENRNSGCFLESEATWRQYWTTEGQKGPSLYQLLLPVGPPTFTWTQTHKQINK